MGPNARSTEDWVRNHGTAVAIDSPYKERLCGDRVELWSGNGRIPIIKWDWAALLSPFNTFSDVLVCNGRHPNHTYGCREIVPLIDRITAHRISIRRTQQIIHIAI